jgi:glycyl-tRNA synthetase beta subunit
VHSRCDRLNPTSHLADLRRSLSTLCLAHTTLSSEHDSLLAAFSRSQTLAAALEKKVPVSTDETEVLSAERERLVGVVEELEEALAEVKG